MAEAARGESHDIGGVSVPPASTPPHPPPSAIGTRYDSVKRLLWLCGSYHHRRSFEKLKQLAVRVGIVLPVDAILTREWLCSRIARQLQYSLASSPADVVPSGQTPVDAQATDECTLRIVQRVEGAGAFGLVYVVRGYRDCVKDEAARAHIPDALVVKTSWAKYDLEMDEFPMYLSKTLLEHYFTDHLQGHVNIVRAYGSWAGPRSRHPNILPKISNTPWIAIKYYDAGDLFSWLVTAVNLSNVNGTRRYGMDKRTVGTFSLTVPQAVSLACSATVQMARGLAHMHCAHVVHGDFKLENCLVSIRNTESSIVDYAAGEALWPEVAVGDFDCACFDSVDRVFLPREFEMLRSVYAVPEGMSNVGMLHFIAGKVLNSDADMLAVGEQESKLLVRSVMQRFRAIQAAVQWCYDAPYQNELLNKLLLASDMLACVGGTPEYDAPELKYRPLRRCVPKTFDQDAWSLGATIYAFTTGILLDVREAASRDGDISATLPPSCLLAQPECARLLEVVKGLLRLSPIPRATPRSVANNPELLHHAAQCWGLCRETLFNSVPPLSRDEESEDNEGEPSARRRRVR